jgi:hypothetical protein
MTRRGVSGIVQSVLNDSDPSTSPQADASDPFAGLPADLAAVARDFDTALRREMRWLAGTMQVLGFGLAAYISWYVQHAGRLWTPREEEWLPALIALVVGLAGAWLWRLADRAPLIRGLVARFPEVRHVSIRVTYRNYRRRTSLVFGLDGPGMKALPIGRMKANDPEAVHLLAEARSACPQASQGGLSVS